MIEKSIARRYAKALIEIGRETNQWDEFLTWLESLAHLCRENTVLLDTLANRHLDLGARLWIVDELWLRLGAPSVLGAFLKVLIQKGRAGLFLLMVDAYRHYLFEIQNKLEAVVTSAKPLNDAIVLDLQQTLSHITQKKIVLKKKTDAQVIGGLSIQMGGELFDGTVRTQLEKMSESMKQAVL